MTHSTQTAYVAPSLLTLTPAARRAVLAHARTYDARYGAVLARIRRRRSSRAVDVYTTHGSTGGVRRYYSTLTGQLLDTESARWGVTSHAMAAVSAHRETLLEECPPALVRDVEHTMYRGECSGRASASCAS